MYCFSSGTGVHLGHCIIFCYALGSLPGMADEAIKGSWNQIGNAVSESKLSNPSLSPSHHLQVRVRVITSESESSSPSKKNFKSESRLTSPVVDIFDISLSPKHENKLPITTVGKAQHGTAATAWTRAWWLESRVTISESESEPGGLPRAWQMMSISNYVLL